MFFFASKQQKMLNLNFVNLLTVMSAFSDHGTHLEPGFESHCYSSHCKNIMIYLFNGIGISSITAYTLWRNIDPIYQTQIEQNFEILTQKS